MTDNEEGDVEEAGVEAEDALPTSQPHVQCSLFSHLLHSAHVSKSLVRRRFELFSEGDISESSFELDKLTPSRGRKGCLRC